jgi:iron(III) transport system permease protein
VTPRSGGAAVLSGRPPVLLTAAALVTVAAVLLPLVYLGVRASTAGADAWRVLEPDVTGRLVLDTLLLAAAVVAAAVGLGVPLAWLVVRTDLPGRTAWAVAGALPLVVPSYVAALAILGALGPRGLAQQLLEGPFGVARLPDIYGFPGAVLALTLSTYPYVYLLAAAALRRLDPSLEEAARALGETRLGSFRRVTLPGLRPAIAAGSLLVVLYVLSDFGAVSLMQYPTLTRAIYLQYQALFDRDPAAVLSLVLVVLTLAVVALESRVRRGPRLYRATPGALRPPERIRLGPWRWPAIAFCAAVVGVFLLLPVAVLGYWTAQAIPLNDPVELAWRAAGRSLLAAGFAAAVAVVAVVPVTFLSQRRPARWTGALERISFGANALPGIVIALSLVFFAARSAPWIYQTLPLLVFAYIVRFLPQALAAVGASLRTVSPSVEEAARSLGRRPGGVLVAVTVPLMRPGLLAGAALVFLSAMKELPATLLLRPIGFDTLATEIWTATSIAAYSQAAPAALLLIAVSAPFVYVLAARRPTDVVAPG